jgi:hypothetical protein
MIPSPRFSSIVQRRGWSSPSMRCRTASLASSASKFCGCVSTRVGAPKPLLPPPLPLPPPRPPPLPPWPLPTPPPLPPLAWPRTLSASSLAAAGRDAAALHPTVAPLQAKRVVPSSAPGQTLAPVGSPTHTNTESAPRRGQSYMQRIHDQHFAWPPNFKDESWHNELRDQQLYVTSCVNTGVHEAVVV